jgi:predicted amidohydrolase YtcJ
MPRQPPSMILSHATVLTMDPQRPRAAAVALRRGRIIAVGSEDEVRRLRGRGTAVVDGGGGALLPGFIDAHVHVRGYASTLLGIDCGPPAVRSLGELQALLRGQAQRRPPGHWLVGYGYDDFALVERRHPTRWDLDPVTPQHPVRLAHRSRHAWVLNSLALQQLGIAAAFVAPPGGTVARDPTTHEPTGLLIDMDGYLRERVPRVHGAQAFRVGVRRASQALLAAGVTTVLDASVSNDLAAYEAFRAWTAEGDLAVRLALLLGAAALDDAVAAGVKVGEGTPACRVRGVKLRLDEGSAGLHPPPEEVHDLVWRAHRQGYPVAIHALEPPALAVALRALRAAQARQPRPDIRHRIEHGALCPEAFLEELAALGIAVVTQPAFLWHHGPRYLAEIAAAQRPWLYRVKSLLDRGIAVAGSSDAPVIPPRPLEGIAAAVARRGADGRLIGAAERVGAATALRLFTQGAAWACGLEAEVGSIACGKRADLVLLEADPTRVPAQEIPHIPVRMTIVDGVVRWPAE